MLLFLGLLDKNSTDVQLESGFVEKSLFVVNFSFYVCFVVVEVIVLGLDRFQDLLEDEKQ